MRKLLIKWGQEALAKLIENSLKGNVLEIVRLLVAILVRIVEVLTDDDKDNSAQVKELLKAEWASIRETLDKLVDSL